MFTHKAYNKNVSTDYDVLFFGIYYWEIIEYLPLQSQSCDSTLSYISFALKETFHFLVTDEKNLSHVGEVG